MPVGEPLLEIGDPRSLEIVADLLSTDAVRVSPGDAVLIEQWGGDQPLEGRVRRVEPSGFMKVSALGVEEQRVNVIIDFDDDRERRRRSATAIASRCASSLWQDDAVLKVPVGSLFRRGEEWAVFVVEDGRARGCRRCELGQRNDREGQVLRGLPRDNRRAASARHPERRRPRSRAQAVVTVSARYS